MKRFLYLLIILFLSIDIVPAQMQFGGYLQTDMRMFMQNKNDIYWNENRVDLIIDVDPADNTHIFSELWIRNFGIPHITTSSDLMRKEKDKVSPWSLLLREAYIDFYGFISPNLDVRIGLQRIAWGTADKFNPTDNLNPDDLEDIWDFGQHLGSGAIRAKYYLDDYVLTAVFIPVFTPASLPIKEWAEAFSTPVELPPGYILRHADNRVVMPEKNLSESSMLGFKVAKNFRGYDLSVSYFYGRDDLPLVRKIAYTPVDTSALVDIKMELFYPRIRVVGMDLAGSVGDVGLWIEGALFYPENYVLTTDSNNLEPGLNKSIILDHSSYLRYVLGLDYTFYNGWYINLQYIHGFFHEREVSTLGDYIIFALEKRLLGEKLKIIPIGGGIEIRKFNDIIKNYAFIFNPELSYLPYDNAKVKVGFRLLGGGTGTVFGTLRDNDEIYLAVRYSF